MVAVRSIPAGSSDLVTVLTFLIFFAKRLILFFLAHFVAFVKDMLLDGTKFIRRKTTLCLGYFLKERLQERDEKLDAVSSLDTTRFCCLIFCVGVGNTSFLFF